MLNKRPWILSLLLVLVMAGWIASGSIDSNSAEDEKETSQAEEKPPVKVRVRDAVAQKVAQSIVLYGRTAPSRSVTLKAETYGRVVEIMTRRGASVKQGNPLFKLALNDRTQQLAHARAQLAQNQLEYEGAKSLSTKGYQGKAALAQRKAALKETQALIAKLQLDIDNTLIKAPFDGVLQDRYVEVGDYVSVSDSVAQVADLNPVIVRGDVTQADILSLKVGQATQVTLSNGKQYTGAVRYIASIADDQTNTFRVEVSLDNNQGEIFGGLSAELLIPLDEVMAVKISSSLLALNAEGVIGIKWVKDDIVQFTPIDVIKNDSDGAWVRGLDNDARIITVGQAFVREGDKVQTTPDSNQDS